MIAMWRLAGRLGNQMFQYAYLYAKAREGLIEDVYVQDPEYFDEYIEEIRAIYSQGIPEQTDMVGIHYRQGDYVGNPFYVDLSSTDYYERAMDMFPGEKFLVFSDDIKSAKKFFVGRQFEFSEGRDEIEDLNLLSSCKHQIIANSSFSLWSGILNPNPNKKVVCPIETKYYSDGLVRTRYPENFIQIDFHNESASK